MNLGKGFVIQQNYILLNEINYLTHVTTLAGSGFKWQLVKLHATTAEHH